MRVVLSGISNSGFSSNNASKTGDLARFAVGYSGIEGIELVG